MKNGSAARHWNWNEVVKLIGEGPLPPGGPRYAPLQQVRAYWEGLKRDGAAPNRAELDPRGMEDVLEHVFLLERIAPGIAKFRLAGMHLTELLGMEARGMPLTTFFLPMSRSIIEMLLEQVFQSHAIVELSLEAAREIGGTRLEGQMLLLPLIDNGICDKALGCLATQGEIGRRPRRFGVARQTSEVVAKTSGPDLYRVVASARSAFAETAATFKEHDSARSQPGMPHLRLVKSDK